MACSATTALARKTNQAVYEDPFDVASGGAALTRATKEGRIFANPALLPQGGSFHRWAGLSLGVMINKESVDTIRSVMSDVKSSSDSQSNAAAAGEEEDSLLEKYLSEITNNPMHLGQQLALSWITRAFGFTVFDRIEPDFRFRQIGSVGTPELNLGIDAYAGAALGMPIWTPWRWLNLGVTGKYLFAKEIEAPVQLGPNALDEINAQLGDVNDLDNRGFGVDAGMLIFLQGKTVDFSLAGKVDDVGNTKFQANPEEFKQVMSAGTALTFHTGADALHLAVDYRDIGNAYGEQQFKKIYAGAKLLMRTYVGLAAGIYHGYPSYGAEIDLIVLRIAFTSYAREMGDNPNVDPRRTYMLSLSMGY